MALPADPRSDAELVADVLSTGDRARREDAFGVLVQRYWRPILVLLETRLPPGREAEDAAQEVFLRAWRSLDRLEDPRLFLGWLLRIARNLATDAMRRERRRPRIASLGPDDDAASSPRSSETRSAEEQLENAEMWHSLRSALRKLPERYRTVVTLRYLQGMTNQEMARALGENEATVRNRLFRALGKLRDMLHPERAPRS